VELYLHQPNTPPWGSAKLKHRDNVTFILVVNPWPVTSVMLLKTTITLPRLETRQCFVKSGLNHGNSSKMTLFSFREDSCENQVTFGEHISYNFT
jgi:hypothetical protein